MLNKTGNSLDLSMIVPVLNEEASIAKVIEEIQGAFDFYGVNGEIVIVNDGSSDRSEEIIKSSMEKYKNIILLQHKTHQGIGKAFWKGVMHANGGYVSFFPGDNENIAEETVGKMHLTKTYDIIVPYVVNARVRSFFRRFLSRLFTVVINITFGTSFRYTNGTNIIKRGLLSKLSLHSNGFFYQTEILVKLVSSGASYVSVPCWISTRNSGQTKAISFKSLSSVIMDFCYLVNTIFKKQWGEFFTIQFRNIRRLFG